MLRQTKRGRTDASLDEDRIWEAATSDESHSGVTDWRGRGRGRIFCGRKHLNTRDGRFHGGRYPISEIYEIKTFCFSEQLSFVLPSCSGALR